MTDFKLERYQYAKDIYFDADGFRQRVARRLRAIADRLGSHSHGELVVSERVLEYPLLFHALDAPPGARILDFGCVGGLFSLHLACLGYAVTGLDFRTYPFRHKNLTFVKGDILSWQPPRDRYDAAVSVSTIEHVGLGAYGDPRNSDGDKVAIDKLLASIRPGGRLYFTVPAGKPREIWHERVYDLERVEAIVPSLESVRFFYKPSRHGEWKETTAHVIAGLEWEDYTASRASQGLAFVTVRK